MEEIINEMDGLFKQVIKYYPMKDLAETKRQWNSLVKEFKNCNLPVVSGSFVTESEANILRQWFNAVQDLNPQYLEQKDTDLLAKILKNYR